MALEETNYEDRISNIKKNVANGKKYMFASTPKSHADIIGGVGGAAFETLNELFGSFITTGKYAGMTESEIFIDGVRYIHIDPARYGADDIKKVAMKTAVPGKYRLNIEDIKTHGFIDERQYYNVLCWLDVDENSTVLHFADEAGVRRVRVR